MLKDHINYDVKIYLNKPIFKSLKLRETVEYVSEGKSANEYMKSVELKEYFGQLSHNLECYTFGRRKYVMRYSFIIPQFSFVLLCINGNIRRIFCSHFVVAERLKFQFTFLLQDTEFRTISKSLELAL